MLKFHKLPLRFARHFSNDPIMNAMQGGQTPSKEELEVFMNEKNILESSWGIDREDINLWHNVEENGVIFKYDLPTENKPIMFRHMT